MTTPEEKRQGAFEEFDELLSDGVPVDEAVVCAAENNELRPNDFRSIVEKELGDLNDYAGKLQLRKLNEAIAAEVKIACSKRHPSSLIRDCYDIDDVAAKVAGRIGRTIGDAEIGKIEEAHRDFVRARVRKLVESLK